MSSIPTTLTDTLREMRERFMPLEEFKDLIQTHAVGWARFQLSVRLAAETMGDDYVSAVVESADMMKHMRMEYNVQNTWQMYIAYKLVKNYPKTCKILETWSVLKGIPHVSTIQFVVERNKTLHNPIVRAFLSTPRYGAVVANCAAHSAIYKNLCPTVRVCKGGNVAAKITNLQWSLVAFWMHVRRRVHAWRTSHSLRISTPYVPKEPLDQLLKRNPAYIPQAAYALSTTIHRDADAFLHMTHKFQNSVQLLKWITYVAAQDTPYAHRALNKVWRTCSRYNTEWYFAFANILMDAPVSHSRLLHSVLNKSLSSPAQYSIRMNALFWKCMRLSQERPSVIAKLLYISSLRNVWLADGHHAFVDLLWTPAVQVNIKHNSVCKALTHYLTHTEIVQIGRSTTRDFIEKSLWESRAIQTVHAKILDVHGTRKDRFLARVPALWWAKKERVQRRAATILNSALLRTLAIRSSYKWRKLQKTPCPICMIDGVPMVPLHMDIRHAICKDCRSMVQHSKNCCPMCRVSLSRTKANKAMVSDVYGYGEYSHYDDHDAYYEDEYYDDDRMYHYD